MGRFPEGPAEGRKESTIRTGEAAGRVPKPPTYSPRTGAAGSRGGAERGRPQRRVAQRVRETGVSSALPSNWVFALCPSFPPSCLPHTPTPAPFPGGRGISFRARGAGAHGPGVQPATVECLFSKDSEIKKVEFTDSPESRKEVASSKLFPRQHPGANGKAGSEAQAASWAPASPRGLWALGEAWAGELTRPALLAP